MILNLMDPMVHHNSHRHNSQKYFVGSDWAVLVEGAGPGREPRNDLVWPRRHHIVFCSNVRPSSRVT